jgi:hypothetical protein
MPKGIYLRTPSNTWSEVEKNKTEFFVKTDEEWVNAEKVWAKTSSGWIEAWDRYPSVPINIQVQDKGADESETTCYVTISWSLQTKDEVPADFLKWQFSIDGTNWFGDTSDGDLREYTFSGLSELTNYNLYVRIYDEQNQYSQGYVNTTTTNLNPSSPDNLEAVLVTQSSIKVSWTIASVPIDFYRWGFSRNDGVTWDYVYNSSVREYTFTGLSVATAYNILVRIEDTALNSADASLDDIYTSPPTPPAPTLIKGFDGWNSIDNYILQSQIDAEEASLDDITRSVTASCNYNGGANNSYCYYEIWLNSGSSESESDSDSFDVVDSLQTLSFEFSGLLKNTSYKARLVSVGLSDIPGDITYGPFSSPITTDNTSQEDVFGYRWQSTEAWVNFGYDGGFERSSVYSNIYLASYSGDNNNTTRWVSAPYNSSLSFNSTGKPWVQARHVGGTIGVAASSRYTEITQIRVRSRYNQSYALHVGLADSNGVTQWQGSSSTGGVKYIGTSTVNNTGDWDIYNFSPNYTQAEGRKYYLRLTLWSLEQAISGDDRYEASVTDVQVYERYWNYNYVKVDVKYW